MIRPCQPRSASLRWSGVMFAVVVGLVWVTASCGTSDMRAAASQSDVDLVDADTPDANGDEVGLEDGGARDASMDIADPDVAPPRDVITDGRDTTRDAGAVCADGEARCDDDEVLVCDRGIWVGLDLCTGGTVCVDDDAGARCVEPECEPDTTWCRDATTRAICADDGLDVASVPCDEGAWCEDGVCVPMICTPGERACVDDATVDICQSDGRFVRRTPCEGVMGCDVERDGTGCSCRDGSCQPWVCEPGTIRCAPEDPLQQSFEICEPHGMGWAPTDRRRPCVGRQVCNSDTVRCAWIACDPGDVGCTDDGVEVRECVGWPPRWESLGTCDLAVERCVEGEASEDAACEDWTCLPGTSRCVDDADDVTELCRDGDGWTRVRCTALGGDVCIDGACVADECRFGPSCGGAGRYVQTCDEETGLRDRIDCGFLDRCDVDALTCRRPICDIDDPSTCRDNQLRRCNVTADGYGFEYVEEPCEWGCADDACGALYNRCHDDDDCGDHRCSGGFAVEIIGGSRVPAGHCMPEAWGWVPSTYRTRENYVGMNPAIELVVPAATDEVPTVRVDLTSGFLVDRTETTWATWVSAMGAGPPPDPFDRPCSSCPVGTVTPWAAMAYANARSAADGLEACYAFDGCDGTAAAGDLICTSTSVVGGGALVACEGWRLPTEVEWELLATDSGSQWTPIGNVSSSPCELPRTLPLTGWQCWNSDSTPAPVASHPTDETIHGLYDTSGNVSEWVHTSAVGGPSEFAEETDPILPFGDDVDTAWLGLRGWNYAGLWTGIEAWRRQVLDGTVPLAHPAIGVRLVRTFEP